MINLEASIFPPVNQLGIITKWLSEPPTRGPWKATINDKNLEVLRVEDRSKTPQYFPNFNILSAQNCFAINFAWPSEISLPSITMSLNSNKQSFRFIQNYISTNFAPSSCMIVMVGRKYMDKIDVISRKIKEFSKMYFLKPLVYFGEKTDNFSPIDVENTPPMVRVCE